MCPKIKGSLLGLSCLLTASGCERSALPDQRDTDQPNAGKPWHWAKAPERSVLEYSKYGDEHGDLEMIRRCWLRPNGYDCLYLSRVGDWYQAHRYQMAKLNRGSEDDPTQAGKLRGYSCSFTRSGLVEEAIAGSGDFITKNRVALYGNSPTPPWTAEYVAAFMQDNGIDRPRTHFDCTELAGQVLSSSVATVGSTAINYAQLMK